MTIRFLAPAQQKCPVCKSKNTVSVRDGNTWYHRCFDSSHTWQTTCKPKKSKPYNIVVVKMDFMERVS